MNDYTTEFLERCHELAKMARLKTKKFIHNEDGTLERISPPELPESFYAMIGKLEVEKHLEEVK